MTGVFRAPMRARELDLPPGVGAEVAIERGVVGIGAEPRDAPKTQRMIDRFGALPAGTFVWTRETDGAYRLGRIRGPLVHDPDGEAGIVCVRAATWAATRFGDDEVPGPVAATFARGGRNLQRIRGAEERTAELRAAALPRGRPGQRV